MGICYIRIFRFRVFRFAFFAEMDDYTEANLKKLKVAELKAGK